MSVPVYYVAHPVGGDVPANVARAKRWFSWLLATAPDVAFSMPWLPYLDALPEDGTDGPNRARGLRDMVAAVATCHGIVLCGGRISNGMRMELDAAIGAGRKVIDLTALGDEPPKDAAWMSLTYDAFWGGAP